MRYNTNNPAPSNDPRDLNDNALILDELMNSLEETAKDRFERDRYTVQAFHNIVIDAKAQIDPTVEAAKEAVNSTADAAIEEMQETAASLGDDLNNKRYSSYAAMNADPQTRDAVVAVVDGDQDPNLNGWYSWNNTEKTWVRFVDQPAIASAVAELIRAVVAGEPKTAFAFTDAFDMVIAKLMTDGTLDLIGAALMNRSGGLSVTDENGFSLARFDGETSEFSGFSVKAYPERNGLFIVDDMGFVVGKVAKDGVFFGPEIEGEAPIGDIPRVAQLDQQVRTGIMQIVGYGQSLSVGETALPSISTAQPFSNLMMASGLRSRYQQLGYDPVLVPLVEQDGAAPMPVNQGETPVSGLANGLVRRIVSRGYAHQDWCFAGMAAGRAGWSIERLSPPPLGTGGVWEDMVNMIKDMKYQADQLNKSYSVWAYSWVQGESNYQAQWINDQYQYSQYLAQLWDLFTEKVLEITGQTFRPYMFTYQVATHRRYSSDKMEIALSQWALSKLRPDVVMAVPCYQFKCSPDNIHLPNEQSWLMGEYFARAMDFTMVRKAGKWRPLEPVSIDWQGDTIDIKYHVPGGKITIDTALCSQARNQGFDIRDINDADIPDAISAVSAVAFDTIRIKLAESAIDSAFRVTYARGIPGDPVSSGAETGARGNVRDTMGDFDKVTSPLGNEFPMHNASVMYQYDRKNGFL